MNSVTIYRRSYRPAGVQFEVYNNNTGRTVALVNDLEHARKFVPPEFSERHGPVRDDGLIAEYYTMPEPCITSAPSTPEQRIAELTQRVERLEQSVRNLLHDVSTRIT
jgi:hypothetical protein